MHKILLNANNHVIHASLKNVWSQMFDDFERNCGLYFEGVSYNNLMGIMSDQTARKNWDKA